MSIVIRSFRAADVDAICAAYRQAFAGAPWFENLTDEQISERWRKSFNHFGFAALVALDHGVVVGSHWWEVTHVLELAKNWNHELAHFARDFVACRLTRPIGDIIWERHLSVLPAAQRRGVGTMLRRAFVDRLSRCPGDFLVLTRMRSDNTPALRTAEKVGFQRTGVVAPSRSAPGVNHEFWYRHVRGQSALNGRMAANQS